MSSPLSDSAPPSPYLLGIDEAGRGPVLGPMVYAYAACPVAAQDELNSLGFADSKALTAAQREALLAKLRASAVLRHHAIELSPQQLSADMQRSARVSLNVISHDAAIALVQHCVEQCGLHVAELYVDTVGDPASYAAKLQALFPHIRITVTAKADSLFPIVSAASIVAKCTRDDAIQQWRFTEDRAQQQRRQQQPGERVQPPLVTRQADGSAEAASGSERESASDESVADVALTRKRHIARLSDGDGVEQGDRGPGRADGSIDHDTGSGYPGGDTTQHVSTTSAV